MQSLATVRGIAVFSISIIVVAAATNIHAQQQPNTTQATPSPPPPTPSPPHNPNDPCTDNLIRYEFGRCNPYTNSMHALQYYDQTCVVPTGTTAKHPDEVSCTSTCPAGQFMDPNKDQCDPCQPGTYSAGPDVRFPSYESKQGVAAWSTRCSPQPCDVWHEEVGSDGSVTFHSGTQPRTTSISGGNFIDESVVSVMTLIINIGDPNGGQLLFRHRTESEHCFDGLAILVNDTSLKSSLHDFWCGSNWYNGETSQTASTYHVSEQSAPFFESGVTVYNAIQGIGLPFGTTEIRFIFRKDANQFSAADSDDIGNDRAYIRELLIQGAHAGSTTCTHCPPGWTTNGQWGQTYCTPCPANHFSVTHGSPFCTACPSNTWSAPGATRCEMLAPCSWVDYVAVYTACDSTSTPERQTNPQRTRYWRLAPDAQCREVEAQIPANQTVDCAACPFGGYRANGQCLLCQPGSQSSHNSKDPCVPCGDGHYGEPVASWTDGFDSLSGSSAGSTTLDSTFFKAQCYGECDGCPPDSGMCNVEGKAFVLVSLQSQTHQNTAIAIRSSLSNGETYMSALDYDFHTASTGAEIEMEYYFGYENLAQPTAISALDPEISVMYSLEHTDDHGNFVNGLFDGTLPVSQKGHHQPSTLKLTTTVPGTLHRFRITVDKWPYINRPPHQRLALYIRKLVVHGDTRGSAASCLACPPGSMCKAGAITPTQCPVGSAAGNYGMAACTPCTGNTVATAPGLTTCTPCYPGSDANSNHSWCNQECIIKTSRGTYDFSLSRGHIFGPEPDWTFDLPLSVTDKFDAHRYFFSLCDHITPDKCPVSAENTDGRVKSSLVCQRISATRSYSLGDERELVYDDENNRVVLRITEGDTCSNTVRRVSNVTLVCDSSLVFDPSRRETVGTFTFLNEAPPCHYNFLFTSALACRQCAPEDFKRVESGCGADGYQTISYLRNASMNCFAANLPASTSVRCRSCTTLSYEAAWSACDDKTQLETRIIQKRANDTDCVDNDGNAQAQFTKSLSDSSKTRACQYSVETKALGVGVIVAILIAVGLVVGLVVLHRKHRQLRVDYERLGGAGYEAPTSLEMGAAGDGHEIEVNNSNRAAQDVDGEAGMGVHPSAKFGGR